MVNFNTPGLSAAYFHSLGSVTYTGTLTTSGTTYRLGGAGGTLTMANTNAITGVGNSLVVKGNVTLSAANNYDTGTTLNTGTLAVGDDLSLGSGALTISGGIIQSADSTAHVLTNALVIGSDVTIGNPTAGNAIVQAVNADQVITNAMTLNQAFVTISGAQSLQVGGIFTNSLGNRTLTNNIDTGKALTLAGQVKLSEHATTGRTLTIAGTGATIISGQIVNGATGAGVLTKTGAGTLTLTNTNTNTYTGATSVTGGTLAVSGTGAINTSSGITVNAATAAFMHNSSVTNSRTFTLTSGTLGGTGTISTAITAGANVTLAPGDRTLATPAKGTLTVSNAVSLTAASSKLAVRLFGPTTNDSDKLVQNTTGTVAFAGALNVTLNGSWTPVDGTTYDLIDWIGTPTGTFSVITLPTLPTGFKWHDYGSGVFFNYTTGQIQIDADATTPTLTSIVDNQSGGPILPNTLVTYTVTFSEDMDAASVTSADFGNAGSSTITIGTITETSPISGVFTVLVTPTAVGTLQLQVNAGAVINDAASNPLDTTSAIVDNTTIAVSIPGFASWQSINGTAQTIDLDHDNDGVRNGIEYFLGGPNGNTTGFTALPGVVNTAGVLSVTWPKGAGYLGVYGTDYVVETSATLSGVWTTETLGGGNIANSGTEVKYTFPGPLSGKNFTRLKVTGP